MLIILLVLLMISQPPARAESRLQGGVQHSETLPSVQDKLKPGQIFNLHTFDNIPPSQKWYKIPDWLAGLWYTKSETKTHNLDLMTGFSWGSTKIPRNDKHIFGMQQDSEDAIWHCVVIPRMHAVKSRKFTEYRVETDRTMPVINNKEVVTVYKFIAVRVLNENQKILDVRQQESVMRIKPKSRDKLYVGTSCKSFDSNGIPGLLAKGYLHFYRKRLYKELPTYRGHNLRTDFKAFLYEKGLSNLIPTYLRAGQKSELLSSPAP